VHLLDLYILETLDIEANKVESSEKTLVNIQPQLNKTDIITQEKILNNTDES
jgi:hypothetical protein